VDYAGPAPDFSSGIQEAGQQVFNADRLGCPAKIIAIEVFSQ